MYKVIVIGNDGYTIKLADWDNKPDCEDVVCFSGDDTDLVPHVYENPNSESAIEKRNWAIKNECQQRMFKAYYDKK